MTGIIMGIEDRDYMRDDLTDGDAHHSVRSIVVMCILIVSLLGSVYWLAGRIGLFKRSEPPAKGSLIVNVNTATLAELQSLPGIGELKAQTIVAGRPYESMDDLARVRGFGSETISKLRPYITIDGETKRRR
jgi:competence ComEA-like helix-hairpin-helix protein